MIDYKVSSRYASSLLDSSIEKKNLDSVIKDMKFVFSILHREKALSIVLKSPVIKPTTKSSILIEIFKPKITEDSLNFLLFVLDKKREELLENIVKKFLELKDEYLGILNIEVSAPYDFSEVQKVEIKKKFESVFNKIIIMNFIINKDLIGGFVAKVTDTLYDASVKHQVELLRKQFLHGNVLLN
jgi:F-type H+-transporting ATPase subunit delta